MPAETLPIREQKNHEKRELVRVTGMFRSLRLPAALIAALGLITGVAQFKKENLSDNDQQKLNQLYTNLKKFVSAQTRIQEKGGGPDTVNVLDTNMYDTAAVFSKPIPDFFATDNYTDFASIDNKTPYYNELINDSEPIVYSPDFREIPSEVLAEIIEQTFPQGWFVGEVDSLKILSETGFILDKYGNDTLEIAAQFIPEQENITMFNEESGNYYKNLGMNYFFGVLGHELGHANDWESNDNLNEQERVELRAGIDARLTSPNRFISSYVESTIHNKDSIEQHTNKRTEYFAEICGKYFNGEKSDLHPDDIFWVEYVIKKKDPHFNIDDAIFQRKALFQLKVHMVGPQQQVSIELLQELRNELDELIGICRDYDDFIEMEGNNKELDYVRDNFKEMISVTENAIQGRIDMFNRNHQTSFTLPYLIEFSRVFSVYWNTARI